MRRIVGMIGTGLFAAIFLSMVPAAQALQVGELTYTSNGVFITITDCSTSATNLVIPAIIDGLPVTSIGFNAFLGCTSLASVYFEGDAPSLSTSALYGVDNANLYYLPGTSGWRPGYEGLTRGLLINSLFFDPQHVEVTCFNQPPMLNYES